MKESNATLRLIEKLTDAWNAQDIETILSCFTADATYHTGYGQQPLGDSFSGADQIRNALDLGFITYPDGKLTPIAAYADENQGTAEWYFEFTNGDDQKVQIHGVDIFKFNGGKVQSKNVYVKHYL